MFEGPLTRNIPEVLTTEVTDGTHVTAGQLALALTPYAQVTDLAVNTAASGNNAAAIQSLDDRVTAELASKLDSSALAPASNGGGPGHHLRAGGRGRRGLEAVQLQHHGGHERFHCLGQQRHTGHGAANYGLKTVDQHSLDIAARITPLEVDTKVANASLCRGGFPNGLYST